MNQPPRPTSSPVHQAPPPPAPPAERRGCLARLLLGLGPLLLLGAVGGGLYYYLYADLGRYSPQRFERVRLGWSEQKVRAYLGPPSAVEPLAGPPPAKRLIYHTVGLLDHDDRVLTLDPGGRVAKKQQQPNP